MNFDEIKNIVGQARFPISKEELLGEAEQKGGRELKRLLEQHLPDGTFASAEEVLRKLPLGGLASKIPGL